MKLQVEWIALGIQATLFYGFPLLAGPTDGMGMVVLLLLSALILSFLVGVVSRRRIRFFFPLAVAAAFLPTVWIYYNETALVHGIWYAAVCCAGLLAGGALRALHGLLGKAC